LILPPLSVVSPSLAFLLLLLLLTTIASPKLPPGLQEIIANKTLLESFHDFTSYLFCEENLLFLEEVMDMKRSKSTTNVVSIFSRYLKEDSPLQVNIDASLQAPIASKFERGKTPSELSIFDGAPARRGSRREGQREEVPREKKLRVSATSRLKKFFGLGFRHEKFGEEKLIGKTRALPARKKDGEIFKMQISLGKLPVKGYFIATLRYASETDE